MVTPPQPDARFVARRHAIFAIVLACFVLSFFHRTAPAAMAHELVRTFAIGSTVLGTLAATYFYVYTVLQIPVGVLADTLGPRTILAGGSAIAGAGSLAFALAPSWEVAAVGRTLVGIGVSTAFIAILKVTAVWFPANRFATLNGVTMFAGNCGAVLAGAPLAWLLAQVSWRAVFVGLALVSLALAVATARWVRDRPEDLNFAPVHPAAAPGRRLHWTGALRQVLANPATWPGFFVNFGVAGSFLAFAGLWAVPYLEQVHRVSRVDAALHASLLLFGVAVGALVVGIVSDRLSNRRGVMRLYTLAYTLTWLPWLLDAKLGAPASHLWFLLMGLVIPGFVLTWTVAKEVNRPEHSGIATAVVNVGIFLGAGMLQPAVGWLLDRGRAAGDLPGGWTHAIALLACAAGLGAVASQWVRETGRRHRG